MHRILLTLIDLVANLLLGQDTLIWIFGNQIRDQAFQLLTKGGNGVSLAGGVAAGTPRLKFREKLSRPPSLARCDLRGLCSD